jgi:two-component system sensor histidine kinase PilS (NtrC family)
VACHLVPNVWVMMDPAHLRQVMWNLLLNAAEAIQAQGLIQIKMVVEKHDQVQVQIIDNGCGISPDVIGDIFDPFFTTKPSGTGLGLSIVHSILESYQSHLHVDSRPGHFAIFSFKIRQIDLPAQIG